MTAKTVLSVREAAEEYGVSESTIRRALRATDPAVFPPPLRAKRKGPGEKAQIVIHRTVLDSWFESWPDAS